MTPRQQYAEQHRAQGLMAWYGYARKGRELAIADALKEWVHRADAPREVVAKSRGTERRPKLEDAAHVPNSVFITATARQYGELINAIGRNAPALKGLSSTFQMVPLTLLYGLHQWADQIEAIAAEGIARHKAGEALSEYDPGERVRVTGAGAEFADWFEAQVPIFRRMVQAAHDPHPMAEVELHVFGRAVPVRVDPLRVRKLG